MSKQFTLRQKKIHGAFLLVLAQFLSDHQEVSIFPKFGHSVLLLEDFMCQKSVDFKKLLHDAGTDLELISDICTCVLQPCDIVVIWSIKYGIKNHYMT